MASQDLLHYGVKGMRWGVRKKSSGKNALSSLSDDDLRKAVERMRLEQQYISLKNGHGAQKSMGKKLADQVISEQGKRAANTLIATGVAAIGTAIMTTIRTKQKHRKHLKGLKDL